MALFISTSYQRNSINIEYPPNDYGDIKIVVDPRNAERLAIDFYNSTKHYRTDYYKWCKRKTANG